MAAPSEWTLEPNQTRIDAILRASGALDDEDSERLGYIAGAAMLAFALLMGLAWAVVAIARRLCGCGCGGGDGGPCADGGAPEDGLCGGCWGAYGAGEDDEDADDAEHDHGVREKHELEAADEDGEDSGADVRGEQQEGSHSDGSDEYEPYEPHEPPQQRKPAVYRGPAAPRRVQFAS